MYRLEDEIKVVALGARLEDEKMIVALGAPLEDEKMVGCAMYEVTVVTLGW